MDTLKVMTKGGKSYIKADRYDTLRVNGLPAEVAKGDPDWLIISGDVSLIEREIRKSGDLIGWKRNDGVTAAIPEQLDADEIILDEGDEWVCVHGYDPNLYTQVYAESTVTWEPVPFEIIDRDCEPVRMESWAKVQWPERVEHYPEVQHKLPCSIGQKDLFNITADALIAHVNAHRSELSVTAHLNIGVLTVHKQIEIPVALRRSEVVDDTPWGAKRKRTKTVTRQTKSVDILRYNGFYDRHEKGEIQTPTLKADNYMALKEAVRQYVADIVAICDVNRWCVCEACAGTGVIDQQTVQS